MILARITSIYRNEYRQNTFNPYNKPIFPFQIVFWEIRRQDNMGDDFKIYFVTPDKNGENNKTLCEAFEVCLFSLPIHEKCKYCY